MNAWRQAEGTQQQKPQELEITLTTVYLRKDIERKKKTDISGETYVWSYMELCMSHEEYESYIAAKGSPMFVEIEEKLREAGTVSSEENAAVLINQIDILNNQEAQDEAIAEILLNVI